MQGRLIRFRTPIPRPGTELTVKIEVSVRFRHNDEILQLRDFTRYAGRQFVRKLLGTDLTVNGEHARTKGHENMGHP